MSDNIYLHVKDFSVFYEPTVHRKQTLRDLFVAIFSSPLKTFFKPKDKFVVMKNISLDIYKGDVVGIFGVNGVGKTTLCRYFSGIIKSEQIKIKGEVRAIFDNSICFYPNLTGRENATILAEMMYPDSTPSEKQLIINEAMEFSELKEFVDSPINTYSRGMRARLYLSLVTAKEADVLVLDEIFGGTDLFFAKKLEERIKHIVKKSGAVILVSHDVNDITKYCNRAIVLADKKIVFDGEPAEAFNYYSQIQL